MEGDVREPCFSCGEPLRLEARLCPTCGRSVLVQVRLSRPVGDERLRYLLARSLSGLAQPGPAFLELRAELGTPSPLPLRGVTRALAARAIEILAAANVAAQVEAPQPAPRRPFSSGRTLLLAFCAASVVVLALGIGVARLWLGRSRPAAPSAGAARAPAQTPAPVAALTSRQIAERVIPSMASLRCSDSVGSGFFVTPDMLLTNAHVTCERGESLRVVLSDRREFPGTVVRSDVALDLALVRLAEPAAEPLPLGDAGRLAVGEKVVMVGSPVGLDFTFHEAVVSNLRNAVLGVAYIQVDARVNPGNSGGPLIDETGRVVGVVSLKQANADGIGFALPINYAYAAGIAWLTQPETGDGSEGWREMLARADEAEREAVGAVSSLQVLPALVGAKMDQYQRLVVRVARLAHSEPRFEDIAVHVSSGTERFCTMKGTIDRWELTTEPAQKAADAFERRVEAWMSRNGVDLRVYVGEAPLRWDLCPRERLRPGIAIELEGADPESPRLTLR